MSQLSNTPQISVVVSTYNRADNLSNCLQSLCQVKLPGLVQVEYIVCDDGSSDDTLAVIRSFERRLDIRYCYQPDQGFRLAASRNMAVRLSKGRVILFLDADALAAPDLVREHLFSHTFTDRYSVVVGPAYGYGADAEVISEYLRSKEGNWWERIDEVQLLADTRMSTWSTVDFRIDRLTEPWTMVMGNNFSVPRQPLLAVGAFDEDFIGWGAEDTDLAYRLQKQGLGFILNMNAAVLHQPHDRQPSASTTYFRNRRRIYYKMPELVTELLPYFVVTTYSAHLDEIRKVIRKALIPDYLADWDESFQSWLRGVVTRPAYLVGGGEGCLAPLFRCTWMSDPDQTKLDYAMRQYPWLLTKCCIGVNLGIEPGLVETMVITDFWRAFNEDITLGLLVGATMVAKKVILLHTPGFSVPQAGFAPAWDLEYLLKLLSKAGLRLRPLSDDRSTRVFEVVSPWAV